MRSLSEEAESFIRECYRTWNKTEEETKERVEEIQHAIKVSGTYDLTGDELKYGAKAAWRNSNRCIGRLFWDTLHVFDRRCLSRIEEVKEALLQHIEYAANGGRIRPVISIFDPMLRIWNHQLIRYAGYETEDGIIGDPDSAALTKACMDLGWEGKGGRFDVLPVVFQMEGQDPVWFEIPEELILEVPITHPEYPWFTELGLKWYAVPIISSMSLEIGGLVFGAAPFNGWYMGTEIGARNLADEQRYDMLPEIGRRMELDMRSHSTLWKDRALVELNRAVLESYKLAGVSIVDHHTAARQFKQFEKNEAGAGREVTGDWTWLIPPISPASVHIFHQSYNNEWKTPAFHYQAPPYGRVRDESQ